MRIEVFKEYSGGFRYFDSEEPDYITWMFKSENHRDQPPDFINDLAPGPQADDTIYFDSTPGKLILKSELSNVVLDYHAPESVLQYLTGTYNAFKTGTTNTWHVEVVFKDDSGIDSGAYRLYVPGDSEVDLLTSTRKTSSYPDYEAALNPSTDVGIKIKFEKGTVAGYYRMTIDIDPKKLSESVPNAIKQCNPEISYLSLAADIYDLAGNLLEFKFPNTFILFERNQKSIVDSLSKLRITFADTYPLNMLIGKDSIGKTTVVVENKNLSLASLGMTVKIGLSSDSVGYLDSSSRVDEEYDPELNQDSLTTLEKVDGIDSTGNVHAFAYIDASSDSISCEISGEEIKMTLDKDLGQRIKNATWAEGVLGRFITECDDNGRRIYVDPFVPGIIKNEEIFGLCKMFERYLNTMYSKMSGDCRIGILEKTHRISDFKDIDAVEPELIGFFAREHGSELNITDTDIKNASDVLKKYSPLDFNNDDIADRVYRRLYGILPYIDRYKGTMRAFDLVFDVLGIDAKIYPLWQDPANPERQMTSEKYAGKDWQLTGHIALELSSDYSKEDVQKLADFTLKAAKSILPVTRVISGLTAIEETEDHKGGGSGSGSGGEKDTELKITESSPDPTIKNDETITFTWFSKNLTSADSNNRTIDIPCYADNVSITGDGNLPDCAAFFLNRWYLAKRTMDNWPLYLKFNTATSSTTLTINPIKIDIRRNRVRFTIPSSESNAISNFNNLKANQNSSLIIKFDFNRAVSNYCKSLNS